MTSPDLYVTWNDSRRSMSLAALLGLRRVVLVPERRGVLRHALGTLSTIAVLFQHRPRLVWFQFSQALGVVLATFKGLGLRLPGRLVVDVHSKALRRDVGQPIRPVFRRTKRWALASCDAVIVTNPQDAAYALQQYGIEALILPDPLPAPLPAAATAGGRYDVVFVCSFATDEPMSLIAAVCDALRGEVTVAITGNPALLSSQARAALERSATLTGFVPEDEYWALLRNARCVVVLTTESGCLPCGAYEAIAVGQRPVLASDAAVGAVFGTCACYSALQRDPLVGAIRETLRQRQPADLLPDAYRARWIPYWDAAMRVLTRQSLLGSARGEQPDPPANP